MSTTTPGQGGTPRPSVHQWHEGPAPGHYQLRVGYADTLIVRPSVVPGAWLLDCPGIGFRGSPICGARDVAHARALAVVMVSSRIRQLAAALESLPQAVLRDTDAGADADEPDPEDEPDRYHFNPRDHLPSEFFRQ